MNPSEKLHLTCIDAYSVENKVVDNNLELEIVEEREGNFQATIRHVGFAGPVNIREQVIKETKNDTPFREFEGVEFYLTLKDSEGNLKARVDQLVSVSSSSEPSKHLDVKMICQNAAGNED